MIRLLYALVPATGGGTRVRGLRGERLRLIRAGGIGALVGDMASRPRPVAKALRAYHAAIVGIALQHAAVIPVRFGTIVADDELMFILRSRAASFRGLLTRVRGRVQMTVRFIDRSSAPDRHVRATSRSLSGSAYLRQRASLSRQLGELPTIRELHDAVGLWIRGERIERHQQLVTVYHLVPRGAADRYRRAVARLNAQDSLQLSGPFPPFAFADPFDLEAPRKLGPLGPGGARLRQVRSRGPVADG